MNFISLLFFSLFSQNNKNQIFNVYDIFQGEWNITKLSLDSEGKENEDLTIFQINLTNTTEIELAGEYNDISIHLSFVDNKTLDVQILKNGEKILEKNEVKFNDLGNDGLYTTGKVNDSLYSFSILSDRVIELTILDTNTKEIILYRMFKKIVKKVNYSFLFIYFGFVLGLAFYFLYKQFKNKGNEEVKEKQD